MADTELEQLAKTGRNPAQETRYQELLRQQQSGGGGNDIASLAAQQLKLYQQANQPAIQALESSIPLIGQQTAQASAQLKSTQTTLEARYKTLVDQIKGNQAQEESRTGIATSQELGRRGISAQSGLYGQTVNEKLQPVTQYYTGQLSGAGNTFQDASMQIANQQAALPLQQAQQENQIRQAIAQLMAGGNTQAIQSALQLYQNQQQIGQQEQDRALQEKLSSLKTTTNPLEQEKLPAEIAKLQAQINKITSGGGGASGEDMITELQSLLQGI